MYDDDCDDDDDDDDHDDGDVQVLCKVATIAGVMFLVSNHYCYHNMLNHSTLQYPYDASQKENICPMNHSLPSFDSRGTPSFAYNVFFGMYVMYACMCIYIYTHVNLYDMYVCM